MPEGVEGMRALVHSGTLASQEALCTKVFLNVLFLLFCVNTWPGEVFFCSSLLHVKFLTPSRWEHFTNKKPLKRAVLNWGSLLYLIPRDSSSRISRQQLSTPIWGDAERLTVAVLKDWLKSQGVANTGKKQELLERVRSCVWRVWFELSLRGWGGMSLQVFIGFLYEGYWRVVVQQRWCEIIGNMTQRLVQRRYDFKCISYLYKYSTSIHHQFIHYNLGFLSTNQDFIVHVAIEQVLLSLQSVSFRIVP